nr:MAG TPA: hypothetical protein [Caudoviricetes sp.]
MKIIRTETIDGMTVNTYDNGVVERYIVGSKTNIPISLALSENEQAALDTAINTEYLVCLADLGL